MHREEYEKMMDWVTGIEVAVNGQFRREQMLKARRFFAKLSLSSVLSFLEIVENAPGIVPIQHVCCVHA